MCRACVGVDQGSDGRVAAELVHVAAAGGPDAADGDTEPDADLGVGHGRVLKQQGDQLLAGGRQSGERLAQRGVALGRQQLLLGRPGLVIGDVLDIGHIPGRHTSLRRAQDLEALPAGHGDEPARKGGRVADRCPAGPPAAARPSGPRPGRRRRPAGTVRQIDHISGLNRSTSASQACLSPVAARVTRSMTTGLSRTGSPPVRVGAGGPRWAGPPRQRRIEGCAIAAAGLRRGRLGQVAGCRCRHDHGSPGCLKRVRNVGPSAGFTGELAHPMFLPELRACCCPSTVARGPGGHHT